MQNIFMSKYKPDEYISSEGVGKYPEAPEKCPYGDCGINLSMKKNGFYSRFLITITFSGRIWIRRYRCPMYCLST